MRAVLGYAFFSIILIGSQGFIQGPSIPGGIFKVKVNLPDVVQAALFAVNALGPGHALIEIVKAKKQIVAGTNYFLTVFIWKIAVPKYCFVRVFRALSGAKSLVFTNC